MNREQKAAFVEELSQRLQAMPHVLMSSFRGLTVNQSNELRRKIRAAGGQYSVIKNRLAKLAAAGTPAEGLTEQINGPCAVATHESDPVHPRHHRFHSEAKWLRGHGHMKSVYAQVHRVGSNRGSVCRYRRQSSFEKPHCLE